MDSYQYPVLLFISINATRVRRKPTGVPPDVEEPVTGSAMGCGIFPHDFAGIGAMDFVLVYALSFDWRIACRHPPYVFYRGLDAGLSAV
jgi:hypothetical protein